MGNIFEEIEIIKDLNNKPKQSPKFKFEQLVIAPIGEVMMVVNEHHGDQLIDGVWIPKVRLGFIKKDKTLNMVRNHRFFTQDRLSAVGEKI